MHTPKSGIAGKFGKDLDRYIQSLFNSAKITTIVAIKFTDYFTIDDYKKLVTDSLNNETKLSSLFIPAKTAIISDITIFPNIEFR